jgi:hypothetical protein
VARNSQRYLAQAAAGATVMIMSGSSIRSRHSTAPRSRLPCCHRRRRVTLNDVTDLEQVRARAVAASDGPWQRHGSDVWTAGSSTSLFTGRDGSAEARQQADTDAEFVAHARQDVVDLLAPVLQ